MKPSQIHKNQFSEIEDTKQEEGHVFSHKLKIPTTHEESKNVHELKIPTEHEDGGGDEDGVCGGQPQEQASDRA